MEVPYFSQGVTAEYFALLKRQLYVGADSELAAAEQLMPWVEKAPNIDARKAVKRIVYEEERHGRLLCSVLERIDAHGRHLAQKALQNSIPEHPLYAFNERLATWADLAAYNLLMDSVGFWHKLVYAKSDYQPLNGIAAAMLEDEKFHVDFGKQNLLALCRKCPEEAQAAIDYWWPIALDTFGHSGSLESRRKVELGIRPMGFGNEGLRQKYMAVMQREFASMNSGLAEGAGRLALPDSNRNRKIL